MTNKDFLNQFSGSNNKPDSFKEEERVKITKEKKPVNVKLLVIILAVIALIIGLVLFFVLRPTIEVKEFVGTNVSEVKAWVKQNEIEAQGIVFKEEYDFDLDEGYIISQSIPVGTKVRKNVKMDFVVSLGADPDELIEVPDIESMYKEELQEWVKKNKLTKTKVMTAYSDTVEEGAVVSYEFKSGADVDNFTRSSSLTITVSKGPQPAGRITVPDFEKKYFSEVETWGKQNNITITKVENYSDKIDKDLVISQSVEAKKEMKQGDTLTVVVSLGKAVYATNLVGKTEAEASRWASKNGVYLYTEYEYSNSNKDEVISQSIEEGKIIKEDMTVVISLGKPDLSGASDLSSLKSLIKELNKQGAGLSIGDVSYENSDTVSVNGLISGYGTVNIGTKLNPVISKGKNIWLVDKPDEVVENEDGSETTIPGLHWDKVLEYDEDQIRELCELNSVNYEVKYEGSYTVKAHRVISVTRGNNQPVTKDSYISESEVITIVISNELLPVTD